ncbi:MAG TPA: tryptophan 2,3-dioxygenase family protein [Luteibaculaceae bacterium]|nr:tryptophan 2,3-dioxygenase family protein [Luteibaculaceae bacterium]
MITPEMLEKLELLEKKFSASGQQLGSYLDGLLHSEYLTYWDYIHLDTLLTLQNPRTKFPDEKIFIMYHQITELYFKLALHEMEQIIDAHQPEKSWLIDRIKRINAYFKALISSFEVMVDGMEKNQFLQFRMALLPASGFQSVQYRMIEIYSTDLRNLVEKDSREQLTGQERIEDLYQRIYWKKGATELATGKKTLTLLQFEEKYEQTLIALSKQLSGRNLWTVCQPHLDLSDAADELQIELRLLDLSVNVNWPLMHYKSAVRYLQQSPADIAATGGTNWQKYLPPRFQLRVFYPTLWDQNEINHWGKSRE